MTLVTGVVLAAGSGTRMGQPKGELVVGGIRLLDRAIRVLHDAGCAPVIAVVRAGTVVSAAVAVVNPDPSRGMRSSLQLALGTVGDSDVVDAVAVLLVDTPGIGADAVRAVVAGWRPGRIAVGSYADGRRGHPIVMAPALWREALTLAGPDEGARRLLRDRTDLVDEIAVDADPTDLDTPADLTRWRTSAGRVAE